MRPFTGKLFQIAATVLALVLLLSSCQFSDQDKNSAQNHYIAHQFIDNSLVITTTRGKVSLQGYGEGAIAVHYQLTNNPMPATQLPSYAIKEQAIKQKLGIKEDKNQLTVANQQLKAVITKTPFSLRFYQGDKLLLAEEAGFFFGEIAATDEEKLKKIQGFRFQLTDTEKLIGGGERVLGMDRRGHRLPLYNRAHYGYTTKSEQMNFSIPAVMSSNKYILLFDNSAKGWLDLGKTEKNILQFEAVAGRAAYIVFAAENYPKLINNYVDVTGKQPLLPRWALGNYASRFGYRTEQEVRDTVNKFIELDFPLDALILDLYWFGKDIKGHMGNLAWDKEAFPTPEKMIADIKAQGVNTVLITEPFVLTTSSKWQDAVANNALAKTASLTDPNNGEVKRFDFYFGNTGLIDVFSEDGQQWFNTIYKKLAQQGVAGWWGDLGEPEVHPQDTLHTLKNGDVVGADAIHNVYGHQWAKMVFENQLAINHALNKKQRPFILMRSGFAGSQRYGMIPWTGDVSRSWGGLKPQVELSLQMSLLGMAYTHSDLGGFAGGETFDQELYIRWLQYGVFQPIYRPHAQDNIAPEVVFHDKQTQDILRKFIKLRYQLLPYNYTLMYQNSLTGMPLMRPMFFEDESDLSLVDNASSYFWGEDFLVTPIVEAGKKSVQINLPEGVWFDYFSEQRYQGKQILELPTKLTTLPVLVRAGAFIPMINSTNEIQSTQDYDASTIDLHYYADSSVAYSQREMYDDDGKSFQALSLGQYEQLVFSAKQQVADNLKMAEQLTISLKRQGQGYLGMPKKRNITLVIHNWPQQPNEITINGKKINPSQWRKKQNILEVSFVWSHQPLELNIQ